MLRPLKVSTTTVAPSILPPQSSLVVSQGAFGFIDPIFSTGVHLALSSAAEAARAILEARKRPSDRARLMRAYDRHINRRISYVSWFIYKIHDNAFREMI